MLGLFTIYRSVACGQLRFFVNAQGVDHVLPGQGLVTGRPGNGLPSLSPMCAQAGPRFTQVIHTVMHSNPIRTGVLTVLCGFGGLTESGLAVVGDPAWNNGGTWRLFEAPFLTLGS